MMDFDAFISYSSKDKATADATCAALEAAGIRCWIAPRDILAGQQYGAAIIEAIEHCRVMILVFSASANESQQIHREVERAVSKGVPVLPLRIEDTTPTKSLEYFIGTLHWLDALTPPLDAHLKRLTETVKTLVRPEAKPSQAAQGLHPVSPNPSEQPAPQADAARPAPLPDQGEPAAKPRGRRTQVVALSGAVAVCVLGLGGYLMATQWRSAPSACLGEKSLRSVASTSATAISFTNYRGAPVRVYWIDYNGARKLYATIGPGLSRVQQTYVGHPWIVADLDDHCIAIYEPESQRRDYAIR